MRSEEEVDEFTSTCAAARTSCKKCKGKKPDCPCADRARVRAAAFEACVPKDFWDSKPSDVKFNEEVFLDVVVPYTEKIITARKNGYGILFLGDNGVGKTMFMSYVLMSAIRRGLTAYYVTMPQLDYHIKRGFNSHAYADRLQLMLTSDFIAIDEMAKERFKDGDSYIRTQVERILKQRFDDSLPVLMATNADFEGLRDVYGSTLASILVGKYQTVQMKPGDFRNNLRDEMNKRMGYGK